MEELMSGDIAPEETAEEKSGQGSTALPEKTTQAPKQSSTKELT
jgi:hypothetical protein